jgi:hypothetical protein
MAYGSDISVFVEDQALDGGATPSPAPWWLSPDIDIPAHPGLAVQGTNQVRIRVHVHDEPVVSELIAAEVYVGDPSLVLSPSSGTVRIDPGNLRFRTLAMQGPEPVATSAGGETTFDWTPSSTAGAVNGPGHRCLVLRAFPESVTPPTGSFDVPNEQHEAQLNIMILTTTTASGSGGSGRPPSGEEGMGVPGDPLDPDRLTGLWRKAILTRALGRKGPRIVVWAFDPAPGKRIESMVRAVLGRRRKFAGFSRAAPGEVTLYPGRGGREVEPAELLKDRFARSAGLGKGLFARDRLVAAAELEASPKAATTLVLGFDHSNIRKYSAIVLHGAQWDADGRPEGGLTLVALAPNP